MKLLEIQNRIRELMTLFVTGIKVNAAMSRTDMNHAAETVLIPLFREVYGYENLKNLNSPENPNFPAIDLGDDIARVAFQITATRTNKKVKDTLQKFVKYKLYERYDRLIIYILKEKENKCPERGYKEIIQDKFKFNKEKDIQDYSDIIKEVKNFQVEKAQRVQAILEKNFSGERYWSLDELRTAVKKTGADLRGYSHTIKNEYLPRPEVTKIVDWVLQAEAKEKVGFLLGQAGSGKTVILREVLKQLEDKVSTLTIKADRLSGVQKPADLAEQLRLPWPVEECVQALAKAGPVLVLLDQLDALPTTLDLMLSTLARLREIDQVKIIASCRPFDINHDPDLSQIKIDDDKDFQLNPLTEAQVNQVLTKLQVDPSALLPGHRKLLTVPLHLKLYADLVTAGGGSQQNESFYTLQDLYQALWQKRIGHPNAPPDSIEALDKLVAVMDKNRKLTAPIVVLDPYGEAATYLQKVDFIRSENRNWLFSHQTFFDYCYARRFVAEGRSLSETILSGPQDSFERNKLVQVLAYLRGADPTQYQRELNTLLFTSDLRDHLGLLLIDWFGTLGDPNDEELQKALHLRNEAEDRFHRFLRAARGNEAWFDLLNKRDLPKLLRTDDEQQDDEQQDDEQQLNDLFYYFQPLINIRPDIILAYLKQLLGKSETLDGHIVLCLTDLESWQSDQARAILSDLLHRESVSQLDIIFDQLAETDPSTGCFALKIYLNRRFEAWQGDQQASEHFNRPHTVQKDLLGEHRETQEITTQAAKHCPEVLITEIWDWFIQAIFAVPLPPYNDEAYPSDGIFAFSWYHKDKDIPIDDGPNLAKNISQALGHIAQTDPERFRALAATLTQLETLVAHRVLIGAYLTNPQKYASDILAYFRAADMRPDRRRFRLNVGDLESPHYDSYRLYGAVFPHLDSAGRAALEDLILTWRPKREVKSPEWRGSTQLRFFLEVDPALLSDKSCRQRQKWSHKYPGIKNQPPQGIPEAVWVGSPIVEPALAKMSDEDLLKAMRKYDDSGYSHPDLGKGGVEELASSLFELVKTNPARFYLMAEHFDETISLKYITAVIRGLAEAEGGKAAWVFELIRRFRNCLVDDSRRQICWSLAACAKDDVPDDLLDLLTDWAINDPDPDGISKIFLNKQDPIVEGINTNRGAAVIALCQCAAKRRPPQTTRIFTLLEKAAQDPQTAVRACVVQSLTLVLSENRRQAFEIFLRLMDGHDDLLNSRVVYEFLRRCQAFAFPQARPFLEAMLIHPQEATREAGARLVCLMAFHRSEAEDLVRQVIEGDDASMRRGAADVYAQNLQFSHLSAICQNRLQQLMNDPDELVRGYVGQCFQWLDDAHPLDELRSFIANFIKSAALPEGAEHLLTYLKSIDIDDEYALVLQMMEHLLDSQESEQAGNGEWRYRKMKIRYQLDQLVELIRDIYPRLEEPAKSKTMDLFERLNSPEAREALSDWDRR